MHRLAGSVTVCFAAPKIFLAHAGLRLHRLLGEALRMSVSKNPLPSETAMDLGRKSLGLALGLSIVCFATGCSRETPTRAEEPRPVKTIIVAQPDDTYVRVFPGKVEASKSAQLSFQVSGLVTSVPVKEGQRVAKGQIIAQLRTDEFQARQMAAKGAVEQAQAGLDALRGGERPEEQARREAQLRAAAAKLANTKTEFERYGRLLPSAAVSRAEYELAQTAYHVAEEEHKSALQLVEKGTAARKEDIEAQEAQVLTADSRLAEANIQLSDTTLRAPYSGVIGERLIEEGQIISPNKPVVRFQNTDDIDIVVDVPEAAMAAGFRASNTAQMVTEFTNAPGLQFPVRVREIAQIADPVAQTFSVRFTMRAPPRVTVLPGMTATVAVTYRRPAAAGNRILVPLSALFKQDTGQQVVWIIGADDTARCREVRVGGVKDDRIEILDGLRPGDRIAVAGAPFLREGMKVRDLGGALGDIQP
jgi:membrane fusion protein, multidrug efflux system